MNTYSENFEYEYLRENKNINYFELPLAPCTAYVILLAFF